MALKPIGRRQALLLGAATLAATACSEQKSGQGQADPVTIVYTGGNFAATLQQLMKQKRFLQDMGLRPNFISVGDGSKVIGALLSGQADICIA